MKNRTRWLVFGSLFLAFFVACSAPTTPRFPDPEENEEPEDPDDDDQPAFLDISFADQPILV